MFGFALHGWEHILILSATVAAVAALGVGLATYAVITLTREENTVNSTELERYKAKAALATADAVRGAAQANERAAELERQAAELRHEAESAKAEAAKTNERILEMKRMRRLEKPQADALGILLKSPLFQSEPKPILRVATVADAEAEMFAMEMMKLFESCGVNIYPTVGGHPNKCTQLAPNANGLVMTVRSTAITQAIQPFVHLQQLMHAIGLPIDVEEDPARSAGEAMLSVLRKPT
jgi:hypothetical protein